MGAKHQFIELDLPKAFKPAERLAIADEVIEHIKTRTEKGVDRNGDRFPKYTKGYTESLDFENAGKTKSVDLTLSGDMLASIEVLSHGSGRLKIGFEKGSEVNKRADGNIRGTYGKKSPNKKKARDFLGVETDVLNEIIARRLEVQDVAAEVPEVANLPILTKALKAKLAIKLTRRRSLKRLMKLNHEQLDELILDYVGTE